MRRPRPTAIAVVSALLIQFVLIPVLPGLDMYATALCVVVTMVLAWFLRDRRPPRDSGAPPTPTPTPPNPRKKAAE